MIVREPVSLSGEAIENIGKKDPVFAQPSPVKQTASGV